ncbi:MAG: phenylalanine--tRNA ligase subunit alpha [Candidatus Kerfeldbacteria bacterium]|nr:phenylalanine--tRNA ligase subunit alpha [Candidatus Kerfeldbacteria bacterium]
MEAIVEREFSQIRQQALAAYAAAANQDDLERAVTTFQGRHGLLTEWRRRLAGLPATERPKLGQLVNDLQAALDQAAEQRRRQLSAAAPTIDPTLPGEKIERGHLHPLTQLGRRVLSVWRSLGYDVHEGPELELDWYNFAGLNIPRDHPSRDIQDTFYIKDHPELVLRTHSSTVQLRAVEFHRKPPLKFVEVGRVFRHEATDAAHESMFTQCDGIAIDRHLTMAHVVTTLKTFFRLLLGPAVELRVRPSHFPFVEPAIEIDLRWVKGKKTTWLEMLGAGMVHPNVLKAMKLDPKRWKGFAWGMGLDRLVLLQSGIPDIRLLYSGNVEFLKQF